MHKQFGAWYVCTYLLLGTIAHSNMRIMQLPYRNKMTYLTDPNHWKSNCITTALNSFFSVDDLVAIGLRAEKIDCIDSVVTLGI